MVWFLHRSPSEPNHLEARPFLRKCWHVRQFHSSTTGCTPIITWWSNRSTLVKHNHTAAVFTIYGGGVLEFPSLSICQVFRLRYWDLYKYIRRRCVQVDHVHTYIPYSSTTQQYSPVDHCCGVCVVCCCCCMPAQQHSGRDDEIDGLYQQQAIAPPRGACWES